MKLPFVAVASVEVWWSLVNLRKVQMVSKFYNKSTHFRVPWSNDYLAIPTVGSGKFWWCFVSLRKVQLVSKVLHKYTHFNVPCISSYLEIAKDGSGNVLWWSVSLTKFKWFQNFITNGLISASLVSVSIKLKLQLVQTNFVDVLYA